MKIRRLSEKTINRIAAGEVVERPLSVVKELVENSIDAGSTQIEVEIERGGRNLIAISDNGSGIAKEDLAIAIERHATSKLQEEDICNITFHGFRGEALPSIASVSRMKITSKTPSDDTAWQIEVLGGEVQGISPSSLKQGTRVEVRDLFYFTPNRLKFLKSETSEVSACVDLINKFALCHTDIAFKLISDGKLMLDYKLPQADLIENKTRISEVLGREFAAHSISINTTRDYVSLSGHISLPSYSRKTAANYLTYVNKRIIKDKFFIGVIKGAYQGLIPHDRYPVVSLFIDIDPYEVDVNVHPTKAEVRFKDEALIRGFLISTIRKAIANHNIASESPSSPSISMANKQFSSYKPVPFQRSFNTPLEQTTSNLLWGAGANINTSENNLSENTATSFRAAPIAVEQPVIAEASVAAPSVMVAQNEKEETAVEDLFPLGFAKCQINNTYIISETKDGFIITDQHAAHERLVLEKMKNQIKQNAIKTQRLLVPEVIDLGVVNVERILEFAPALKKFGFSIERNGLSQILITEVPYILGKLDTRGFILDFCDNIVQYENADYLNEKLDEVCGNIACHASIRAGRKLSLEEMNAILREMEQTPFSGQCNHGRPTYHKLSLSELEKMFERS